MTDDLSRWATWREIHAQPAIWSDWSQSLPVADLRSWIAAQGVDEIWFCGAGTSAYIGDMLVAGLEGTPGPRLRAVPTTDIVSRPQTYLAGRRPLVVNFGRSGNSTETIGTLDALDALAPTAPRLNITCNPKGALATRPSPGPQQTVLLPEATHDAGFAMTSSFSTMF
jgi:tagatose-6-phosphate ketose/aldose isomerase